MVQRRIFLHATYRKPCSRSRLGSCKTAQSLTDKTKHRIPTSEGELPEVLKLQLAGFLQMRMRARVDRSLGPVEHHTALVD